VLKGLLTPILEETINYVNAPVVARERGIEVKEVKSSDAGDFTSLVTIQVEAEKKTSRIAGALYGRRDPRIVQLENFRVEIVPEGHMLFILNYDRPGVIGQVGQILGEHQINIARMQCSREEKGGQALLIVGVDAPLPSEVLRAITDAKNIISVKLVRL
jgi:D-3-phosphoglycerate dehydrogenase